MSIRRILVALDGSPHSLAALKAAAEMAARLHAELTGIFVEDINLLRLAGFPFACEVGSSSATRHELDRGAMERKLKASAERARHAMTETAGRLRIHWSFRVARGSVPAVLLASSSSADLVVLGRASRALCSQFRLGSTARHVMAKTPCGILVLQEGVPVRGRVMVVYEGMTKSLSVAVDLARASGTR